MFLRRIFLLRTFPFRPLRTLTTSSVEIEFKDGLANITVPLPSRNESCVFQLKPFHNTIGDFIDILKEEDRGIDRASIYLSDGSRLSRNSPIELIFEDNFTLKINETSFDVRPTNLFASTRPAKEILSDVSNSVTKLYHDLRLNQYVLYREKQLENQLTFLRDSVRPLNEIHVQLANKAIRRLKWFDNIRQVFSFFEFFLNFRIQWSILAAMSFQTGVLFRLVWIDYR